ncbi:MAG TPA: hypothetical protein DDY91_13990 [Planctomycetaceae bacterium]|nr:hypothetical protein [Planctomycetaceae bacterium]
METPNACSDCADRVGVAEGWLLPVLTRMLSLCRGDQFKICLAAAAGLLEIVLGRSTGLVLGRALRLVSVICHANLTNRLKAYSTFQLALGEVVFA